MTAAITRTLVLSFPDRESPRPSSLVQSLAEYTLDSPAADIFFISPPAAIHTSPPILSRASVSHAGGETLNNADLPPEACGLGGRS